MHAHTSLLHFIIQQMELNYCKAVIAVPKIDMRLLAHTHKCKDSCILNKQLHMHKHTEKVVTSFRRAMGPAYKSPCLLCFPTPLHTKPFQGCVSNNCSVIPACTEGKCSDLPVLSPEHCPPRQPLSSAWPLSPGRLVACHS